MDIQMDEKKVYVLENKYGFLEIIYKRFDFDNRMCEKPVGLTQAFGSGPAMARRIKELIKEGYVSFMAPLDRYSEDNIKILKKEGLIEEEKEDLIPIREIATPKTAAFDKYLIALRDLSV